MENTLGSVNLVKGGICPMEESNTSVLLNMLSNCFPNSHVSICRSVLHSALVREDASDYHRQRGTAGQRAGNR